MSCITVKFFDKEYSIPNDVVTYVDLIDFTNGIRDSLISSFKRQIRPSVDVIESDTFMVSALNDQALKFISKLLENDIYDRTANDYLQNNKGYELFLDTKKKVVNQLISIRTEKLNTYRTGVEDAIYRKESSVTGLDFGVITSSFVNSMIYAYMDASEQTKQEKEALRVYNQEIAELNKQVAEYDRQESDYIIGNVIPAMNTVFTFFAYELLDKFIADLIRYDKFDKEALKFINLERSNDLLKNLILAGNKKAVIESAFAACPFNANVYAQALNYGFIDYDTYLTAHHFKQDKNILNTLVEKLGEVEYPDKFRINYVAAEQLAKCTGRDVKSILQEKTRYYANAVVKSYKDIVNLLYDKDFAVKTIYEFPESAILAGDAISKGQASSVVEKIIKQNIWLELVDKCGHSNLIDDFKKLIPEADNVFTKRDLDSLLTDKLYSLFETVRLECAKAINEKKEQERIAKEEAELAEKERQEKRTAKKEENKHKLKKALKIFLPGLLAVIVIFFATSFVINDVIKPAKQYKTAVALMDSGDYQGAINIFASLGRYKDSENLSAQCINADLEATYNNALQLMADKKYSEAIFELGRLNGYSDSESLIADCEYALLDIKYDNALSLMSEGRYEQAIAEFEKLGAHKDSYILIQECNSTILENKYKAAFELMSNGELEAAITSFEAIIDYKDSIVKVTECKDQINENKYNEAVALANNEAYDEAILIFDSLDDYKDSANLSQKYMLLICDVGDVVTFGKYEQDNNLENGAEAIEWIVLERTDERALLISKYSLDSLPFNNTAVHVTWANSTIRSWLNQEFFNSTFSENEKSKICLSKINNPDDPDEINNQGTTTDRIFLLSLNEATRYFDSNESRDTQASEYAISHGNAAKWLWMLRSPGQVDNMAYVTGGEIGYYDDVNHNMGIRPVMWIEIRE